MQKQICGKQTAGDNLLQTDPLEKQKNNKEQHNYWITDTVVKERAW